MEISLSPEMQKLIQTKVEAGEYRSATEVVDDALKLLSERDLKLLSERDRVEQLRKDLQEGIHQVEQGNFGDYDESSIQTLFDEIGAEGAKKFAMQRKGG